ncbi:UNVERIFIED_CONTAM: hypothetical protein NCL1_63635 [Trichonephila clavipes]
MLYSECYRFHNYSSKTIYQFLLKCEKRHESLVIKVICSKSLRNKYFAK